MGSSASTLYHTDPKALAHQEFDYIIVGSGEPYSHHRRDVSHFPMSLLLYVDNGANHFSRFLCNNMQVLLAASWVRSIRWFPRKTVINLTCHPSANRLSADPKIRGTRSLSLGPVQPPAIEAFISLSVVLLVEAGGKSELFSLRIPPAISNCGSFLSNEKQLLSRIPAAWAQMLHSPSDWQFSTTYVVPIVSWKFT